MSAFDAYAAAFAAPYREAMLGDERPVTLRLSRASEGVSVRAILFEVRQESPELASIVQGVSERTSSRVRDVEFTYETLRAAGGKVAVGMLVDIEGEDRKKEPWQVRRVVSDTAVAIRVECSRKVKHERAHASVGGGAR